MPRLTDYTRVKMSSALRLAQAVHELGDRCKKDSAAANLNMSVKGGRFSDLVSTATKFGFLQNMKGDLIVTEGFQKEYLNAYDEKERIIYLQSSFFKVPLYNDLYKRFANIPLPDYKIIPKLLIREYGIDEGVSSRVSSYFIDDAKTANLLDYENRKLVAVDSDKLESKDYVGLDKPVDIGLSPGKTDALKNDTNCLKITISGPGINVQQIIETKDDLDVIKAILDIKIAKKFQEN